MTWLYLVNDRSVVFSVFRTFHAEVTNQFGRSIKRLRTDNAREYFSQSNGFQEFLSTRGIIHQSSCAHTSQQNGVAERRLRSLLDGTGTLLIQMGVPKTYWGDALLTARLLANRLPSSILGGSSPFALLHPQHDPFPLTPRVFGCVCFVHNLGPELDKLDPRAERCIFLGYSRTQKGYWCHSPRLRRSFVSADVTFFEFESYFITPHEDCPAVLDSNIPLPRLALPDPIPSPSSSPPLPVPESCMPSPFSAPPLSVPPSSTFYEPSSSLKAPEAPPPAPTKTYQRKSKSTSHQPPPAPSASQPEITTTSSQVPVDSPIASRTRSHSTAHPISSVVSYDSLTPMFQSFVSSLSSVFVPQSLPAALDHPGWSAAMDLEMEPFRPIIHGIWFPFHRELGPSVAAKFTTSNTYLTGQLSALRRT
ncbi:uncharacterized protein LOC143878999 [Tasmannia lanceolata]|uniref:uncharacterized protein LOC143878999 n=1 Tax=Tasmannia lanceolata TaxID=3420 RepID=UPI0040629CE9